MKTNLIASLYLVFELTTITKTTFSQEFSIATGTDNTSASGIAFDGNNYMIAISGNFDLLYAQLINTRRNLVSSRISLGVTGGMPLLAFDGDHYLMVWSNLAKDSVFAQFISTGGDLIGKSILIASDANIELHNGGALGFAGDRYLIVYKKNTYSYARCISKTGDLLGEPVQVCKMNTGDMAMAFDGKNYLLAWYKKDGNALDEQDIYGQLISKNGELSGSTILIDDDYTASDNPISVSYDGIKFLVTYHVQASKGGKWNLYGRFVSVHGNVWVYQFNIRDSSYNPGFANAASDGSKYLITWTDHIYTRQAVIKGRFFDLLGNPIDSEFEVCSAKNFKIPMLGGLIYSQKKYLQVSTLSDLKDFSGSDIWGTFIPSSPIGTGESEMEIPELKLFPNPVQDKLCISIPNAYQGFIQTNIYNMSGQMVLSENRNSSSPELNLTDLGTGIYIAEIQTAHSTFRKKFLIE